ncbi:MAG: FAD-binding protein [Pseudomonadota bacterium]|uniref:FAD-binding protein n=2 Tax=Burkholderiales TaxID=80840 RepID=UPI001485B628|nr:FAD-binding protein [Burkholderia sp. 4M9327F10]
MPSTGLSTMPDEPRNIDTLALLGLKAKSNIFDLSSDLVHVSMRDQIVRAQILVRDLCAADPNLQRILVVGAGVAGISAAMAAGHAGKTVVVVDTNEEPLSLQAGVLSRYVGPFMYEWPSILHADQSYPPVGNAITTQAGPYTPRWASSSPMPASEFARQVKDWLKSCMSSPNAPMFWMGVKRWDVGPYVKLFAAESAAACAALVKGAPVPPTSALRLHSGYTTWPEKKVESGPVMFNPDYILLAGGMGIEETRLASGSTVVGEKFWEDDDLKAPETTGKKIAVFGGGDGALQDVLRALTRFDHPLDYLNFLNGHPKVAADLRGVLPRLMAIEQQSRLISSWTQGNDVCEHVDAECFEIARELAKRSHIRASVRKGIRSGSGQVHHFVRGKHFTKAYLLNRFLVHLVRACREMRKTRWPNLMDYAIYFDRQADGGKQLAAGKGVRVTFKNSSDIVGSPPLPAQTFDKVVVRYGVEEGSTPGKQMVQLSAGEKKVRSSIGHVPMPMLMPAWTYVPVTKPVTV